MNLKRRMLQKCQENTKNDTEFVFLTKQHQEKPIKIKQNHEKQRKTKKQLAKKTKYKKKKKRRKNIQILISKFGYESEFV